MTVVALTSSSFDLDNLAPELRELDVVRNPYGRTMTEDEVGDLLAGGVVGMIAGVEPLTASVFDRAPDLRVVARLGTGMDSVDLDAAAARDLLVSNTPDAPTAAVAELTLGLILAVLRRIPDSDARVRAGDWPRTKGHLLGSRTVGLVGGGRIGRAVARLVAAFGADVCVADPALDHLDDLDQVARLVSFDELLERCDLISLHVPLTDATRHLIDAEVIARTRPGTVIVNASRGGIVDEEALEAALRSGHLGGAAIDAFDTEPYTGPLSELDSVVLSPHVGSSTVETRQRMEREASANLLRDLRACGVL